MLQIAAVELCNTRRVGVDRGRRGTGISSTLVDVTGYTLRCQLRLKNRRDYVGRDLGCAILTARYPEICPKVQQNRQAGDVFVDASTSVILRQSWIQVTFFDLPSPNRIVVSNPNRRSRILNRRVLIKIRMGPIKTIIVDR